MPKNQKSGAAPLTGTQMNRTFGKFAEHVMDVYVLIMLCIFPLFTHDAYFDILETRFGFFWSVTLGLGVVMLLLGIFYLITDRRCTGGGNARAFLSLWNLKYYKERLKPQLLPTDIPFAALILIYLISMALSGYPYETWWGNRGRYMGVLMWLMLFLCYVCITRFYRFKRWQLHLFMVIGSFICLWGISDFFEMNLFGLFDEVSEHKYWVIFASSIGNINSYTAFTAMLAALSTALFITAEKWQEISFYYIVMAFSNVATVCGMSDNAVFSFGMLYAAVPLLFWKKRKDILRSGFALWTTFAAMRIGGIWISTPELTTISTDYNNGVLITIGKESGFTFVVLGFGVLLLIAAFLNRRALLQPLTKLPRRLWTGLIVFAAAAVIAVFIDANTGHHPELWQNFSGFLYFNDQWGTGRGFAWRMALTYFAKNMPFIQRIFGYGPDTYYLITMDNYFDEMVNAGYGMFDSVHNEFLNYLLTIGIAGLLLYLLLCFRFLKNWLRKAAERPELLAAVLLLLVYHSQAFINICVPIVYPLLMVLFSMFTAKSKRIS